MQHLAAVQLFFACYTHCILKFNSSAIDPLLLLHPKQRSARQKLPSSNSLCGGAGTGACLQAGVGLMEHGASILPQLLALLRACLIPLRASGIGGLVRDTGVLPGCLSVRSDGLIGLHTDTTQKGHRTGVPSHGHQKLLSFEHEGLVSLVHLALSPQQPGVCPSQELC